jgi:hypothetical protein
MTVDEIKLQRASVSVGSLVDDIDRRQLLLPEIQRDYVWKPAQVAGLFDSLYREYPSGSILLWETDEDVSVRPVKIEPTGAMPTGGSVQYLIDGQQRITSLHRVFNDPDGMRVVFNIESEKFQIQSAATERDPRWVAVHTVLHEPDLYGFVDALAMKVSTIDRNVIGKRLGRVQAVGKYVYHVEIISNLPYQEVTEIFIRVNSKGRALKTTDLALATLSAKWRGVMAQLEKERDVWKARGYPAFDLAFLARCIAAAGTSQRTLAGFKDAPVTDLQNGWAATKRGIGHLTRLLEHNAGIATSTLIPSSNALIPLVAYLGSRPDDPLHVDDANALLYWMFGAFLTGRYNQSSDTRIAEDAKAVREPQPIVALYQNLGLLGDQLGVTEQALVGKGAGSPYFLLSFLAARKAAATDWWYAIRIGLDANGGQAIEYHHIHPQDTLKKTYSKSEINDLSNLAFISARANKKISNRWPRDYFPEVGDPELARHFVPLALSLRTPDKFPEFVQERRRLLAAAMTSFLDSYRPAFISGASISKPAPDRLLVTIYPPSPDRPGHVVQFEARRDSVTWIGQTTLPELQRFLSDIGDGLTAGLTIGEEVVSVEGGQETLEVAIGPYLVTGRLDEWQAMVERELDQEVDGETVPAAASGAWTGERVPIAIAEAE